MQMISLDVTGHKDARVPNTYFRQAGESTHLGIILPGYRYSADRAELHFASRILLEQGADLLRVEYAYNQTDFMELTQSQQDDWISADVFAACNRVLSLRTYGRFTLVGKSLGTIAMGYLLADPRFQKATCIWSTPLLSVDWLPRCIEQVRPRSLFIMGSADPHYKPEILKNLAEVTRGRLVIIEGATHPLEIPGSIPESLNMLGRIVTELEEFLGAESGSL